MAATKTNDIDARPSALLQPDGFSGSQETGQFPRTSRSIQHGLLSKEGLQILRWALPSLFLLGGLFAETPEIVKPKLPRIRATLDEGCSVGSGCTLGACTSLKEGEALGDEMVVIGPGVRHGEPGAKEAHVQAVLKYIEVLKETLPRCHHLRKSNVKS
eukprot:s4075_g4.t1